MRQIFPLSARVSDARSMGITILIYIAASISSGFIFGALAGFPFLEPLLSMAVQMANLYCLGGIVTAVLFYRNMIG